MNHSEILVMCTCLSLVIGVTSDWPIPSKVFAILCACALLIDVVYQSVKMIRRYRKNG